MAEQNEVKQNERLHAAEPSGLNRKNQYIGIQIEQELAEQTEEFWANQSQKDRRHYYSQIDLNYHTIADEFFKLADMSVDRFSEFTKSHITWRRWVTILTGGLVILNLIAAYTVGSTNPWLKHLPLVAAIFAAIISIYCNLENLYKYAERAQAYREVREILLSAAREYEMLWHVYVRPFSDSPMACVNAAKIYRQIVEKDQEIRGQAKELTKIKRTPLVPESGLKTG